MERKHIIGIVILSILLLVTLTVCIVLLLPKPLQKPSLTLHGMSSNIDLALDHLPKLQDAYQVNDSVVFPVALFNGFLPLLMIHVGESNTVAAAIIDSGSEMLLLADTERCTTCSSHLFGGAKGSDSKNNKTHGKGIIEFGSQKDHVEFRKEDIRIDGFVIPKINFGLVTDRQSLTKDTNVTYNIMGIGGAQTLPNALLNQLHTQLRPNNIKQFGFMLGYSGNDNMDDEGVFVLGKIPKSLLDQPVDIRIPLHKNPLSSYYYTTHVESIYGRLKNGKTITYPIKNFPIMFDTGSNYSDFPKKLKKHFDQLNFMIFNFSNNSNLIIPNNGLIWKQNKSPLVTFTDTNIITIGTVILSKFKAFEFILNERPYINIYNR